MKNSQDELKDILENIEIQIQKCKVLIDGGSLTPDGSGVDFKKKAEDVGEEISNDEERVIEGVFDGQNMIGPSGKAYPVPANYASKSKLIPGDVLKLTIAPNGAFIYKQIAPVDRIHIKGVLGYEEGQYRVLCENKSYKVLLASVTYFKAEVGDTITLIVPEKEECEWGAIENVIPRLEAAS